MEEDAIINQSEAMEEDSTSTKVVKEEESAPVSNGGLLNQLMSNIIPSEKDVKIVTEEEEGRGKGEGGILENLISNLTSPKASNAVDFEFFEANSDYEQEKEQEQQQQQLLPEKSDGGGGLMDSIVSHIPPISISENEGPNSDEASMLIHVVQD